MAIPHRTDPLAPLLDLPGVEEAVVRAREALVAVHNHPVNRRGWPATAEGGHLRRSQEYRRAAAGFAAGTTDGLATWLRHCCAQWEAGAAEGLSIAEARTCGPGTAAGAAPARGRRPSTRRSGSRLHYVSW